MARSYRKTPAGGITTASSERLFKQQEHQRERHAVKQMLSAFADDSVLPDPKRFGNPWAGPKDGKRYWADRDSWQPDWRRK